MGNTDQVFLDFPWKLSRFYLDYGVIEVPNSVPSQSGESPSPRRASSRTGDSPELLPSSRESMFRRFVCLIYLWFRHLYPGSSNGFQIMFVHFPLSPCGYACLSRIPMINDLRGPYKTDLSLEQLRRPPCIEGTAADEFTGALIWRCGTLSTNGNAKSEHVWKWWWRMVTHHFCLERIILNFQTTPFRICVCS